MFCHDRDDLVIPVDESRRLRATLGGHAGVHYTEFAMFQHMGPTKRKLSPLRLLQELGKSYLSMYPMFRQAVRGERLELGAAALGGHGVTMDRESQSSPDEHGRRAQFFSTSPLDGDEKFNRRD